MKASHLWPSSVVLAAALASAGAAAEPSSSGVATVRGGPSLGGRAAYLRPKDGEGHWYGGAQLRLGLSRTWALEGSVDYRRERFGLDTRADVYPVQGSLLGYLFPESPVSPFVLFGAGWYFTHVEGPGGLDRTQHRFGPHVGGGLQVQLSGSWSLDGSYRYAFIEDVRSRDAGLLDKDYGDRGHMTTAALNYHF